MTKYHFQSLSKDDLLEILAQEFNLPYNDIQHCSRGELWKKLKDMNKQEPIVPNDPPMDDPNTKKLIHSLFDTNVVHPDVIGDTPAIDEVITGNVENLSDAPILPIANPQWNTFVLDNLLEEEKEGRQPTTDGLRRLVRRFIGRIIQSVSDVVYIDKDTVAIKVTITILPFDTNPHDTTIQVSGVGEANSQNTEPPYDMYKFATAETRAEGRALRRILGLRKVLASEELPRQHMPTNLETMSENITDPQATCIEVMGRRLGINLSKLLVKYEVKTIKQLTYKQALELIQTLNDYQDTKQPIPPNLLLPKAKTDSINTGEE